MSTAISTGLTPVDHSKHIVCCTKQPGTQYQKAFTAFGGAAGIALVSWGMAETIKSLVVCGSAIAGLYGAGIVLLALAAILWVAVCFIQYRSVQNQENEISKLRERNIELQTARPTTGPAVVAQADW